MEDNQDQSPADATVVRHDILVEDLYTSCVSEVEAVTLREDVTALMAKGGASRYDTGSRSSCS